MLPINIDLYYRNVDELATFNIFRWVSNVFHILLNYMYNNVWFGPICVEKWYFIVLLYIWLKYNQIPFSPTLIIQIYVVNNIIWTWSPVVAMFTFCFVLCQCLLACMCDDACLATATCIQCNTDSLLCHPCLKLHHVEL